MSGNIRGARGKRLGPEQKTMLNALAAAWREHLDWPLGRVIDSAATIGAGPGHSTRRARNPELLRGFLALQPDPDEFTQRVRVRTDKGQ